MPPVYWKVICWLAAGALVGEADLQALVEEGHHLQALEDRLGPELDLLEDRRVRPERHRGAGAAPRRRAGRLAACSLSSPPSANSISWCLPSRSISSTSLRRQGVDHRDPHAVQAAGHLVAGAAELAAGVQGGEHQLGRGLVGVLRVWARPGCPAPSSTHPAPAVGQQRDVDLGGSTRPSPRRRSCRRPPRSGGAGRSGPVDPMYIPGRLPDRFEAFEDGDVAGVVRARGAVTSDSDLCLQRHARALSCPISIGGRTARHSPERACLCALPTLPVYQEGVTRRANQLRHTARGSAVSRAFWCAGRRPRTHAHIEAFEGVRAPHTSRTRPRISGARCRICVAQAGWSALTTSVTPSTRTGGTCAATDGPTSRPSGRTPPPRCRHGPLRGRWPASPRRRRSAPCRPLERPRPSRRGAVTRLTHRRSAR